jgi:hypothetical protein
MYIESKADGLIGPARIGRVSFSKTGPQAQRQSLAGSIPTLSLS